jgi:hypothetical protein
MPRRYLLSTAMILLAACITPNQQEGEATIALRWPVVKLSGALPGDETNQDEAKEHT